jgi:hypothetical protein
MTITSTATPSPGLVYDIIDREGQIVDRVQAPANAAVNRFWARQCGVGDSDEEA